jgi:hypothetical protein
MTTNDNTPTILLQPLKGALLNDYVVEEQRGFPLIRMPDIAWGAEA